ncbi:PKD domain-containing protein [Rhodocytophaga aerolata]|uniref:PKD domain-containing protein n=1 Tax=Rhodocytophaga aerolata TaxID=455078 RepID=A0ABT8R9Q4_9BACT|nr:PKD domain-containing protein [Rhodocytophaga aerolata]MDO1448833.1 PKD domain-containing protein [Rhodocytophaga aerolata]
MQKIVLLCILLFLVIRIPSHSQCPQPAFTLPDTVCINEPFNIINNSTNAVRYEWDFCSGDLEKKPTLQTVTTLTTAVTPTDITHVFDGLNWYGFVSSRDNHKLFRLDYGSSLDNTPAIVDLGNPSGLLSRPEQMKIIKVGSEWIGMVVNLNNFVNGFSVTKLNFGNSLTNVPVAIVVNPLKDYVQFPRGIELINDNGNLIALIANTQSNVLTIVNFGNSFDKELAALDIKSVPLPNTTTGHNIMGISVLKVCDQWVGLAVSYSNKMYKLQFGNQLFSAPSITPITVAESLNLSPVKVSLTTDSGKYYGFVMHSNGKLLRLDFGSDMVTDTPQVKEIASIVGDMVGMELTKTATNKYYLYTVDWQAKYVYKLPFPQDCSANNINSTSASPTNISYNTGGIQKITLVAYNSTGNSSIYVDSVFVRQAITADFTATNLCEGSHTQFFSPASPVGNQIKSWLWDFGDGTTSNAENPIHSFATAGTKPVKLIITDVCNNSVAFTKDIGIYKTSTASFVAPVEVCSYEEVSFQDASTIIDDTIVAWKWDFGNGDTLKIKNPIYTYKQPGNYAITLTITGISGCTVSVTKSIVVNPGANVNFSVENACFGNQTAFRDLTEFGNETNFVAKTWNFGDGYTSDLLNPVHQYQNEGSYTVTLSVQNDRGCTVTHSKIITISQPPQPSFSYSLACNGEPTLFFDESTVPQGEITSWLWNFGDPSSGVSNLAESQNPSHIFSASGSYAVTLKVQTIYGCVDSISRTIQVIQSPQSRFAYQLDCTNKQVNFSDQTFAAEAITSWYWDFGDNSSSTEQNPAHIYSNPGTYTVSLITTAASRCTNSFSQAIQVNDAPIADFILPEFVCINTTLLFTDQSRAATNDYIINWEWDFGSFGTSTQRSPSIHFASEKSISIPVTLKITTAAGCQAMLTNNILLQAPPVVAFVYKAVSTFTPLQLQFSSSADGEMAKYFWEFGDGEISEEKNPVHTYKQSGTYLVSLRVENAQGCQVALEKEITLSTVADSFELKLEYIEAIPVNGMLQLTAYIHNNSPYTIQELDFVTILNGQDENQENWQGSLQPGKGLKYTYTIAQSNISSICIFAEDAVRQYTSNRQCISLKNQFSLLDPYPNPANRMVTLPVLMPAQSTVQISVRDVTGRKVYSITSDLLHTGFNEISLGLAPLKPGMYLIQLNYAGNSLFKKFIVQ